MTLHWIFSQIFEWSATIKGNGLTSCVHWRVENWLVFGWPFQTGFPQQNNICLANGGLREASHHSDTLTSPNIWQYKWAIPLIQYYLIILAITFICNATNAAIMYIQSVWLKMKPWNLLFSQSSRHYVKIWFSVFHLPNSLTYKVTPWEQNLF